VQIVTYMVPFVYRNRAARTYPLVVDFVTGLRTTEHPSLPFGAAGFCWGGKHTTLLTHASEKDGKPLIDVGFTAHPSSLSLPGDIEGVKKPLSIAVGDGDPQLSLKGVEQVRTILGKKTEVEHEVIVYPGATHGFAVRADPADEKQQEASQKAEDQAVAWFEKWFGRASG